MLLLSMHNNTPVLLLSVHNNKNVTAVYAQQYACVTAVCAQQYNYDKGNRVGYLFLVCWKY
jgi:hypothetical protein